MNQADDHAIERAFNNWPTLKRRAGSALVVSNEPLTHVALLTRGVVVASAAADDRTAVIGIRCQGWLVGGSDAMTQAHHQATITCFTDCELRMMPADAYRALLKKDPAVLSAAASRWSREIDRLHRHIAAAAHGLTKQLLMDTLQDLFAATGRRRDDGTWRLGFPLSVSALADALGVSRQWTSVLLQQLIGAGILEKDQGWLVVRRSSPISAALDAMSKESRSRI